MKKLPFVLFLFSLAAAGTALAADDEALRDAVFRATTIFNEKQGSARPIPQAVLDHARAIGVIEITKGAFGVGGADGEGIIVARTPAGWSAPFAFTQGGGSVGFQIGVDIKRYIYIFNTDAAYRAFTGETRARFQAGAQATAGPDSATRIAADGLPDSAMYVYTLSDGAFAGASVGGQLVGGDADTNRAVYGTSEGSRILGGAVPAPPYAAPFVQLIGPAPALRATMKPGASN